MKFNRRNIYARDSNRCQYCGKKYPTTELSLDHVIPRSRGGRSTCDNVVCCCIKCNVKKGGDRRDGGSDGEGRLGQVPIKLMDSL